jgi:hypothetical protein
MSSDGDGRSDGRTAWTLGAIKQRNLALEGYCQTEGCGHFYVFKVDDLIASAGPDYVVPEINLGDQAEAVPFGLEHPVGAVERGVNQRRQHGL